MPQLASQSTANLVSRIRSEYGEMPGLKLTAAQAQRLWDINRELCDSLMADLVMSGFLARTSDGSYVRRDRSFVR